MIALIADLADILAKPERVAQIIKEELDEVKRKFGDKRRTELMIGEVLTLEDEDLIEETDVLITLSNKGYIKRLDQGNSLLKNVVAVEFKVRELRMMTLCVSWFQPAPMIICSSLPIKDAYID